MAIRFTTTDQEAKINGLKCLVHGPSGAGKTTLLGTITEPLMIISAEGGMLSLGGKTIPVSVIDTIEDLNILHGWVLNDPQFAQFRWIALDSISEVAEKILAAEKALARDPRKAYGEMQDQLWSVIRKFRDLPGRNVVFTAKQERVGDTGFHQASLPGNKAGQGVDYFFDEVFALRAETDPNDSSKKVRALQTGLDDKYAAKDRSGGLDFFEPPNLMHVKDKIMAHLEKIAPRKPSPPAPPVAA